MSREDGGLSSRGSPEELPDMFQEWTRELEMIEISTKNAALADRTEYESEVAAIEEELNQLKASQEKNLEEDIHKYMVKVRAGYEHLIQELRVARFEQLNRKFNERAVARKQSREAKVLEHYNSNPYFQSRGQNRGQPATGGQPRPAAATIEASRSSSTRAVSYSQSPSASHPITSRLPVPHPAPQAAAVSPAPLPSQGGPLAAPGVLVAPSPLAAPATTPAEQAMRAMELLEPRNKNILKSNGSGAPPIHGSSLVSSLETRPPSRPSSRPSFEQITKRKADEVNNSPGSQPSSPKRARVFEPAQPQTAPSLPNPQNFYRPQHPQLPQHPHLPQNPGQVPPLVALAQHEAQTRKALENAWGPEPHRPSSGPQHPPRQSPFGQPAVGQSGQPRAGPSHETSAAQRPEAQAFRPPNREHRTISFDEVYCNGKPKYYHTIVEFPLKSGKRYILKCEQHYVHFKDNPIAGAAKHLFGAQHPGNNKRHDNAIAELGFLIPDCTAEMAEKNNAMSARAYANGYKPFNLNRLNRAERQSLNLPFQEDVPNAQGHDGVSDVPDQSAASSGGPVAQKPLRPKPVSASLRDVPPAKVTREFRGISNPVPGELYLGYWSQTKTRYAIMVFPIWGDISCTGMSGTIADVGLLRRDAPRCYKMDRSRSEILGWAEGYEDGGPYMNNREFPVVYFESKRQVGWLHARFITPFDFENPHWREIPFFLGARDEYARLKGFANYQGLKAKRGVPKPALTRQVALSQRTALPPHRPERHADVEEHDASIIAAAAADAEMSDGDEDPVEDDEDDDVNSEMADTADSTPVDGDGSRIEPGTPVVATEMELDEKDSQARQDTMEDEKTSNNSPTRRETHDRAADSPAADHREATVSPLEETVAATDRNQRSATCKEVAESSPKQSEKPEALARGSSRDETVKDSISVAVTETASPTAAQIMAAKALSLGSPAHGTTISIPTPTATVPTSPEGDSEQLKDARFADTARPERDNARTALPSSRRLGSLADILSQEAGTRHSVHSGSKSAVSPVEHSRPFEPVSRSSSAQPLESSMRPPISSSALTTFGRQHSAERSIVHPRLILESNGPTPPDSPPLHQHAKGPKALDSRRGTTGSEAHVVSDDLSRRSSASPTPLSAASTSTPLSGHATTPSAIAAELSNRWKAVRASSTPLAISPADSGPTSQSRARSTASPVAGFVPFFKSEPSAERELALDLIAYTKDTASGQGGITYASEPSGACLRLVTSSERAVAETTAGSAVNVIVLPHEVSKLVVTAIDEVSARVAVTPKREGEPMQYLTFARNADTPGSKAGKIQARQFCLWVRGINPAVSYHSESDPLRRGSVASRASVNSPLTPTITLD